MHFDDFLKEMKTPETIKQHKSNQLHIATIFQGDCVFLGSGAFNLMIKLIYSEKATTFCKIFTVDLSVTKGQ